MGKENYLRARDEYIELIKQELLGPGSEVSIPDKEHELITNAPDIRYSIGILFPKNNKLNADSDDVARVEVEESVEALEEEEPAGQPESEDSPNEKAAAVTSAEEDNLDEEISLASQNMPSSLGITFLTSSEPQIVNCSVEFATYRQAKADDCKIPFYPEHSDTYEVPISLSPYVYFDKSDGCLKLRNGLNRRMVRALNEKDSVNGEEYGIFPAMYKLCDQLKGGYVREPHRAEVIVNFGMSDYADNNKCIEKTQLKVTALKRKINSDLYSVTLMLVNDESANRGGMYCIFQPTVTVSTENNNFLFREYSSLTDFDLLDEEEQSLALQYRNKKVYGTGLGTSVNWDIDITGRGKIYNDFFPEVEVPSMDFSVPSNSGIDKETLSMRFLSDLDETLKEEKLSRLKTVIDAYDTWINELIKKKSTLEPQFDKIATANIAGCQSACSRMLEGLHVLERNDMAWSAFLLANRAMFMQRIHLKLQEQTSNIDRYPGDKELSDILDSLDYADPKGLTGDNHFWRLFQIAFLLMSIESIVNDASPQREIVDLIWFPTGGGKTEAYLGLTAFTIFYRRLAHLQESDGTAVIMRYTLRLLAAQQFTRASTLICACEYIRHDATLRKPKYGKYPLGDKEISIGLWIGSDHIPNTNKEAKSLLQDLSNATPQSLQYVKERSNKFQVLKCPWCGTKMVKDPLGKRTIGMFGYRMRNNRYFELFCPQESCFYNQQGKLPIQIIDQELYACPPTLLFGTVDKFAMMPWKREIGAFFAVDTENRTPDLIIQDELHLISGPLGTMVGLYESAIDLLCKAHGVSTKVIASTATIRRAKEQCAALYNRDVSQFPHPGLDAEDSFLQENRKLTMQRINMVVNTLE